MAALDGIFGGRTPADGQPAHDGTAVSPIGVEGDATRPQIDPVLVIVQYLARAWRKPDSQSYLTAGLPLADGRMTLDLVPAAFARIGVTVAKTDCRLADLAEFQMPALVDSADGIVVLLSREGKKSFRIFDPRQGVERVADITPANQRSVTSVLIVTPNYEAVQESSGTRFARSGHWMWSAMSGHLKSAVYVLLAATFINVFAIAFPIFTLNVYDRVLPNSAVSTLWVLAVGLLIVMVFDAVLKLTRGAIIEYVGRTVDFKLSSALFDRVLNTTMDARPASTGAFVNRISQYEVLREFFASSTLVLFIDLLFLGVFAYVIASLVGWLVWFPLIAGVIAIAITTAIGALSSKAVKSALSEANARNSILVESLTGSQTVKASRAEGQMLRRWETTVLASSETQNKIKWYQSVATNMTATLSQLSMAAIIIGGVHRFSAGEISMGAIIAAMMLSNRLIAPIAMISGTLLKSRAAMEAYSSIDAIMKMPDERKAHGGKMARTVTQGRLAFNRVRFAYPGTKTFVLDDLNFSIEPGEKVGIIGRIGSGKTTLGRLLVNFHKPTEGEIIIDGADIEQFHPSDLRRGVGLVLQDPELFNGSVRENILLSDPGASEDRLRDAVQKAGVESFVSRHPMGLEMPVGERGIFLSGGQRQAVALARTLLVDPKILFLDEPSSSMDLATERQLIGQLEASLTPDQTVLIATHRYSLLSLVTRLMVIDNGRLAADGPKAEVLAMLKARGDSA
ncbi:MAG: type I secretion system permease/ATPase [Devosia sp.]